MTVNTDIDVLKTEQEIRKAVESLCLGDALVRVVKESVPSRNMSLTMGTVFQFPLRYFRSVK